MLRWIGAPLSILSNIRQWIGGGLPQNHLTRWTSWWVTVALTWAQDGRLVLESFVFMPLSVCRLWGSAWPTRTTRVMGFNLR